MQLLWFGDGLRLIQEEVRKWNFADFIMLNEDGTYKTAFSDIPFYSKEQVRACFSDSDYNKKSHCYDESWSVFNISIIDNGSEFYLWEFITKSYNWPSFVDKARIKKSVDKKHYIHSRTPER